MKLRSTNVDKLATASFDVLVVGGGINGAVSAACLAARGAKVALVDRGDFAGMTSQESSNLAWGGIKYLEGFEVGLVRKLCRSRNHLIESYPSTVQEIRFYTVHPRGFRHGLFKLFLGTLFYWLLGGFFTKAPRLLSKRRMREEEPIPRSATPTAASNIPTRTCTTTTRGSCGTSCAAPSIAAASRRTTSSRSARRSRTAAGRRARAT
jgi:glycerol-3-phosphate dehydrogenase